ncbi:unnamed protein product [Pleuronectes platessa]|uniref:Uncharacterized protein n=1 Tax=Pleuronectes platessa TaxID=8262 RepID=A0A9N7VC28_PLEPL|nr:unnamed protein product [Pleuronectes platessa]
MSSHQQIRRCLGLPRIAPCHRLFPGVAGEAVDTSIVSQCSSSTAPQLHGHLIEAMGGSAAHHQTHFLRLLRGQMKKWPPHESTGEIL